MKLMMKMTTMRIRIVTGEEIRQEIDQNVVMGECAMGGLPICWPHFVSISLLFLTTRPRVELAASCTAQGRESLFHLLPSLLQLFRPFPPPLQLPLSRRLPPSFLCRGRGRLPLLASPAVGLEAQETSSLPSSLFLPSLPWCLRVPAVTSASSSRFLG